MMGSPKQKAAGIAKRALLLEALRQCGEAGGISTDLGPAAGTSDCQALRWLKMMTDQGLVGCWPDPCTKASNRLRWWAKEFLPAHAPLVHRVTKSGVQFIQQRERMQSGTDARPVDASRATVIVAPGYTHDPRYQVAPGASVHGAGFAAMGVGRYLGSEACG